MKCVLEIGFAGAETDNFLGGKLFYTVITKQFNPRRKATYLQNLLRILHNELVREKVPRNIWGHSTKVYLLIYFGLVIFDMHD